MCQPTPGTRRREPSAEKPLRGTQHRQLGQPETEELKCHISLASIYYIYIHVYIHVSIERQRTNDVCVLCLNRTDFLDAVRMQPVIHGGFPAVVVGTNESLSLCISILFFSIRYRLHCESLVETRQGPQPDP